MNGSKRYQEMAAELDELAAVPTAVLGEWVTARGRCLWETTFGEPPKRSGEHDPDRELAAELCAGCPVRAECLELIMPSTMPTSSATTHRITQPPRSLS